MLEIHQGNSLFCFRFEGLTLQLLSCTNSWSLAVQSIFKSTWKISVTRIPRMRTFSKTLPCRNLKLVFESQYINLQLMPGLLSGGLRSLFNGLQQLHTHSPPPSPNHHPTYKYCFQLWGQFKSLLKTFDACFTFKITYSFTKWRTSQFSLKKKKVAGGYF